MRRARALVAMLPFLTFGAACVPRIEPAGPPTVEPALEAAAFLAADGTRLPMRRWLPDGDPGAVILALHGFNDYSNAFEDAGLAWRAHGIATYAYDQRGFGASDEAKRGLWPGIETLVADLKTATELVRARHARTPLFLVGESMGSAVALLASVSENRTETDGMVLMAPATRGWRTLNPLQAGALWITAHTLPWLKLTGQSLGVRASDNDDMLRALGRDPLVIKETRVDAIYGLVSLMDAVLAVAPRFASPALVLYGHRDEIVPQGPVMRFVRALPKTAGDSQRIALYDDGFHLLLRDLQSPVVLGDIAAWALAPEAPLPSGADERGRAWIGAASPSGGR